MKPSAEHLRYLAKEAGRKGGLARARNIPKEIRDKWSRKGGKASGKARALKKRRSLYGLPAWQ